MQGPFRSLADSLRSFDDDRLLELLSARPDLGAPAPQGISQLAARAASASSVQRALLALRRPELEVLSALAVLPDPSPVPDVAAACGTRPGIIGPALDRLRTLGLVWGRSALHTVRAVRTVLATPAGLAAPDPTDPVMTPDAVRQSTADLPPAVKETLDRLAWGPPIARSDPEAAGTARLRELGLLRRVDASTVMMPRTVQLAIRGGRIVADFEPDPPALTGSGTPLEFDARQIAAAAIDAGFDTLRVVAALSDWDDDPPGVLRRGGLAMRDLRRLAQSLEITPAHLATVLEAAWSAGLIAHDDHSWQLTRDWDDFRARPMSERWAELAVAWLTSSRIASLSGTPDAQGQARSALSEATARDGAKTRRQVMMRLVAAADPTTGPVRPADLSRAVHWYFPLLSTAVLDAEAEAFVTEAGVMGLLGAGVPAAAARAAIKDLPEDPVAAVAHVAVAFEAEAPPPVDEIVLQSDLVAIIPGRPGDAIAPILRWTEPVSRGGAMVVRFTPDSVRRALLAGRDPAKLRALLEEASPSPVPQPLLYLIRDEERKYGQVRIGRASAYLVADPAVLDTLAVDATAGALALTRIAPTVAITRTDPGFVLQTLREAGLSPVPEGPDGQAVRLRPQHRLTGGPAPSGGDRAGSGNGAVPGSVPSLRLTAQEVLARIREADAEGSAPNSVTDRLLEAIGEQRMIRIGVVDGMGGITERDCRPLSIEAGRLRGVESRGEHEFTVLLSRVTLD